MGLKSTLGTIGRGAAAATTLGASEMVFQPGANPFTQSQKAQTYDPNQQNFQLGQDPYANQQTDRLQGISGGLQDTAAGQRAQGDASLVQQGVQQGVANDLRGNISGAQDTAATYRGAQANALGMGGPQIQTPTGQDANLAGARGSQEYQLAALNAYAQQPEGPSAAESLLRNQGAANMRQNLALAASGRGTGSAGAMRAAIGQNAVMQGQTTNAAAAQRANDFNAYKQRELAALNAAQEGAAGIRAGDTTLRGQDVTLASNQLGADVASRGQNFGYAGELGRQGLGYEQVGLGYADAANAADQTALGYGQQAVNFGALANQTTGAALGAEQLGLGYQQAGQQGGAQYEQLRGGSATAASIANMQGEAQRDSALLGMGGSLGAGAMLMSDEKSKKNIKELEGVVAEQQQIIKALGGPAATRDVTIQQPDQYQPPDAGGIPGPGQPWLHEGYQPLSGGSGGASPSPAYSPAPGASAGQASGQAAASAAASVGGAGTVGGPEYPSPSAPNVAALQGAYNGMNSSLQNMGASSVDPMRFAPPMVMSDEQSKKRIQELESANKELAALVPRAFDQPVSFEEAAREAENPQNLAWTDVEPVGQGYQAIGLSLEGDRRNTPAEYGRLHYAMALGADKGQEGARQAYTRAFQQRTGDYLAEDQQSLRDEAMGIDPGLRQQQGLEERQKSLEAVRQTPAIQFEYQDPNQPGAASGVQAGISAQDLEKTPVGNSVVQDTPQGKMVDTARLSTVNTGAINAQQQEIDAIKQYLKQVASGYSDNHAQGPQVDQFMVDYMRKYGR